jgi:FtsP/CotA-like multicopper oxidase with cupredoxin domain
MYHCHFEDVEHVQMGMNGIVYVHPAQNYGVPSLGIPAARLGGSSAAAAPRGYAYNDGVPPGDPFTTSSTAYDREFALMLNEVDPRPHDGLEAVQEFLWTDYSASYWIINGRAYPDTILPNEDPSLPSQPISSLVQVNAGERVLLRLANLGYEQHAMQLPGIRLKVVGHDATLLRGASGADTSYEANTIYIGPGEARDVLFVAPAHSGGAGPDVYLFSNRNVFTLSNGGTPGLGGMATEVWVYPAASLPPQSAPNETYAP